jgi:putative peptide zinc metalloprotease protein
VLAVALPVLAGLLVVGRFGRRWLLGLSRWSSQSGRRRVAAVGLVAVVVTGLAWAWAPRPGNYRPITPGEKGLLTAVLPGTQGGHDAPALLRAGTRTAPVAGAAAHRRLADKQPLNATFEAGQTLPTRGHPQLAAVLVPVGSGGSGSLASGDRSQPWVFPFSQPLPPGEGDNQAAAINTADDTTTYDVAFALVWATGDEVDNVNAAYAYASCSNCVTVAVAFQVVLIMDDAHVVVPQNLAVAANYDCYRCITAAIASQLVLSVTDTPGQDQLVALADVWNRLLHFGQSITTYSLAEISTQLEAFKTEITAILASAPTSSPSTTATATDLPTELGSAGASASAGASESPPAGSEAPTSSATAGSSDGSSDGPSDSPSDTPMPTATTSAVDSATAAPEPSGSATATASAP